ncbi:MAG TPA: guanylate kinase [Candidatus Sulfotelmatobacter sp.]|jgi:guanylate kinase|nr:guanylate kinase [Candidatus Sulfotelmatobacter sp.]
MSESRKPLVYIISAPSGSGKSTLTNEILKLVPNLVFSISYTTRAPRGSEQNGKQYHFVPIEEFNQMVRDGEFLEHANVHGNCYGTARKFLREAGQSGHDLLLDIDVQGASQVKKNLTDSISIFVLPPDRSTLEWRLRNRKENREDDVQRRLKDARREIEEYDKYDYVLINDQLEKSIERLEAIVLSERLRREVRPLSQQEASIVERAERLRLANLREKVQPILASFRAPAP